VILRAEASTPWACPSSFGLKITSGDMLARSIHRGATMSAAPVRRPRRQTWTTRQPVSARGLRSDPSCGRSSSLATRGRTMWRSRVTFRSGATTPRVLDARAWWCSGMAQRRWYVLQAPGGRFWLRPPSLTRLSTRVVRRASSAPSCTPRGSRVRTRAPTRRSTRCGRPCASAVRRSGPWARCPPRRSVLPASVTRPPGTTSAPHPGTSCSCSIACHADQHAQRARGGSRAELPGGALPPFSRWRG
jgi:hypothetical protein